MHKGQKKVLHSLQENHCKPRIHHLLKCNYDPPERKLERRMLLDRCRPWAEAVVVGCCATRHMHYMLAAAEEGERYVVGHKSKRHTLLQRFGQRFGYKVVEYKDLRIRRKHRYLPGCTSSDVVDAVAVVARTGHCMPNTRMLAVGVGAGTPLNSLQCIYY